MLAATVTSASLAACSPRIRTALHYFNGLEDCDGAEIHLYRTPMYSTVLHFDDEMVVTPHLYARPGYQSPLLRLRRLGVVAVTWAGGTGDDAGPRWPAPRPPQPE